MPLAMGAVVVGVPTTFQTPLSGQISPVLAVVPIGLAISVSPSDNLWTINPADAVKINRTYRPVKWGSIELYISIITRIKEERYVTSNNAKTTEAT